MAGQGPAPKVPEDRVSLKVPLRGDWMSLPPLEKPVLPALPRRKKTEDGWLPLTRLTWDSWRADWATQAFGPSEIAMAMTAIMLFDMMLRRPEPARCAEVRQWMDRLGLNLKGKRDLRLRLEEPKTVGERSKPAAQLGALRLVDDAVPA